MMKIGIIGKGYFGKKIHNTLDGNCLPCCFKKPAKEKESIKDCFLKSPKQSKTTSKTKSLSTKLVCGTDFCHSEFWFSFDIFSFVSHISD